MLRSLCRASGLEARVAISVSSKIAQKQAHFLFIPLHWFLLENLRCGPAPLQLQHTAVYLAWATH